MFCMHPDFVKRLHTNQRLLIDELSLRGASVDFVDEEIELLVADINGHKEYLLDRFSSIFPYPITKLVSDKIFVKRQLRRNKFSVPEGRIFNFQ